MGSKKITTVKSRALRFTKLDVCGAPAFGSTKASIVSVGGFSKIESEFDVEAGAVFRLPDAWGDYCVNEKDKARILGGKLNGDFCRVDPAIHVMASGARALVADDDDDFATTGDDVGFAIGVDTVAGDVAIEMWTKVGGGACVDGDPVWLYTLWPWVTNFLPGKLTFEKGAGTFPATAEAQGASEAWESGAYDAGPVIAVNAGEVFVQRLTLVQPPAATNGAVTLAALTP